MGYWSAHPMSGDDPDEVRFDLMAWILGKLPQEEFDRINQLIPEGGRYDTIEDAREDTLYQLYDCDYVAYQEVMSRLVTEHIDELIQYVRDSYEDEDRFALPFMIADEFNVGEDALTDERLAALADMVGDDGGGGDRGYEDTDEECPQKYARELHDHLRDRLTGRVTEAGAPGLFQVIFEEQDKGHFGLVNVP